MVFSKNYFFYEKVGASQNKVIYNCNVSGTARMMHSVIVLFVDVTLIVVIITENLKAVVILMRFFN